MYDLNLLEEVIRNLEKLLGIGSPDVTALRLRQSELTNETLRAVQFRFPPLFKAGFGAFVDETARATGPSVLSNIDALAIGLDPDSPWTLWNEEKAFDVLQGKVPNWVVSYMREAMEQSKRTGQGLNIAKLVRRTGMPSGILATALELIQRPVQRPDSIGVRMQSDQG